MPRDQKMAALDAAVREGILYKFCPIAIILATMWYGRDLLKYHIYQRAYAWILNKFAVRINKGHAIRAEKEKLFRQMFVYKQKVNRDIKVLEVGAGSAANLDFFPPNTRLVTIDPNVHFEGYIRDNLQTNKTVISAEITKGVAENLPFSDGEFDIVVCTLVLCTVEDIEKSLSEIKRVLKQNGLLLFLEHVAAEKKTWTWRFQGWIRPVMKIFADGCDCQRETELFIREAKFSKIHVEHFRAKKFPIFLQPCIQGYAVK